MHRNYLYFPRNASRGKSLSVRQFFVFHFFPTLDEYPRCPMQASPLFFLHAAGGTTDVRTFKKEERRAPRAMRVDGAPQLLCRALSAEPPPGGRPDPRGYGPTSVGTAQPSRAWRSPLGSFGPALVQSLVAAGGLRAAREGEGTRRKVQDARPKTQGLRPKAQGPRPKA